MRLIDKAEARRRRIQGAKSWSLRFERPQRDSQLVQRSRQHRFLITSRTGPNPHQTAREQTHVNYFSLHHLGSMTRKYLDSTGHFFRECQMRGSGLGGRGHRHTLESRQHYNGRKGKEAKRPVHHQNPRHLITTGLNRKRRTRHQHGPRPSSEQARTRTGPPTLKPYNATLHPM